MGLTSRILEKYDLGLLKTSPMYNTFQEIIDIFKDRKVSKEDINIIFGQDIGNDFWNIINSEYTNGN